MSITYLLTCIVLCIRGLMMTCCGRGFYPRGGGEVVVDANPMSSLRSFELLDRGSIVQITGRAFVGGTLPVKVAESLDFFGFLFSYNYMETWLSSILLSLLLLLRKFIYSGVAGPLAAQGGAKICLRFSKLESLFKA